KAPLFRAPAEAVEGAEDRVFLVGGPPRRRPQPRPRQADQRAGKAEPKRLSRFTIPRLQGVEPTGDGPVARHARPSTVHQLVMSRGDLGTDYCRCNNVVRTRRFGIAGYFPHFRPAQLPPWHSVPPPILPQINAPWGLVYNPNGGGNTGKFSLAGFFWRDNARRPAPRLVPPWTHRASRFCLQGTLLVRDA